MPTRGEWGGARVAKFCFNYSRGVGVGVGGGWVGGWGVAGGGGTVRIYHDLKNSF